MTFPFRRFSSVGLDSLRDCISLAFVPARPTLALLSGHQEMTAGAQMEARQQELLNPGKWQAQGRSFSTGMTSIGFVC